jgi:hypothetical protein
MTLLVCFMLAAVALLAFVRGVTQDVQKGHQMVAAEIQAGREWANERRLNLAIGCELARMTAEDVARREAAEAEREVAEAALALIKAEAEGAEAQLAADRASAASAATREAAGLPPRPPKPRLAKGAMSKRDMAVEAFRNQVREHLASGGPADAPELEVPPEDLSAGIPPDA